MSIADINFTKTYTPPPSNAVNLRLGVSDVVEVDPLSAVALMSSPAPKLYVTSAYNSRTSRPVAASPDMAWQRADRNDEDVSGGWVMADKLRHPVAKPWQQAQPLSTGVSEHVQAMDRLNLSAVAVWPAVWANNVNSRAPSTPGRRRGKKLARRGCVMAIQIRLLVSLPASSWRGGGVDVSDFLLHHRVSYR